MNLIGEKGIESLRTSEIAERVGFSEAALYRHFSNKLEVIKATIRAAGEKLIETLTDALDGVETEDELKKLRIILETHLNFVRENPGISRLLFSDEVHFNREDLREELLGIIDRYRAFVAGLIERGIEKEQVRKDLDVDTATTFYLGLIQSQILFWSLSGGQRWLENEVGKLWTEYERVVKKE